MKLHNKVISIFVILTFLLSNVAFAIPDKLSFEQPKNAIVTSPDNVIVSRDFGLVKNKFNGNSGKLIIHIQDAHCNYEAQTNIVHILESLIKNYSLGLVSVEGADGFIDTSWFKAFPDDQVRKEVADYFMKKGEITGPEFLSITTNLPFKLFGAETRSYYIQNLNAFTSSYPLKDETEKYFNSIKTVLNRLKGYIYSDELKALDTKVQDYESKKLQFNDYVRFMQALAEKHKINIRSYENFFRLVSVLIYEKKIDFNVTDKERSALIDELSKGLNKDLLQNLVTQSISFKSGKISSADYYAYLKNLAQTNGIDLSKKYTNLYNYIIYNAVYSKIENEKLFKDLKDIEIAVKEKLFANDDQRMLEKLSRHIDILLGLINIKLMNGDFDYYREHKAEFANEYFEDFLKKKTIQYGLAYEIAPPADVVAQSIPKLEDFYSIAMKRDKALVDNTLTAMNKEKQNIAVLVTGGFHSEGIAKLLEKQGVSYMVVCPSITKDVPSPYIQILTNQRTPLEDILVGTAHAKEGMVAVPSRAQLISLPDSSFQDYIKRLESGEKLALAIGAMENEWVDVTVTGAKGAATPVGRVNIQGVIDHLKEGVGGSIAGIVNQLRGDLHQRCEKLHLPKIQAELLLALLEEQLTSPDFKAVTEKFEAEYNARTAAKTELEARRKGEAERKSPGSDTRTPGTGAVRNSESDISFTDAIDFTMPYTDAEAEKIDKAIARTILTSGKSRQVFEPMTRGTFVVLDDETYMKYAAEFGAPSDMLCHPGTKGTRQAYKQNPRPEVYEHQVERYYYIKESLFDKLSKEAHMIFANHEELHIKIALGIIKVPEGENEERFVNSQKGCDIRPIMARLGSVPHMADMLITEPNYGDAAKTEIERLIAEGKTAQLTEFVKTVYARRFNILKMKKVLREEPYKGYDVIIISSTTEGEAEEQAKNIRKAFEVVRTGNAALGNKVCVLSIYDPSEGGQIIGQNTTWDRAAKDKDKDKVKSAFKEWAAENKIPMANRDLERLYSKGTVKIATYHNGGKAERFSPAGQAFNLSRADQPLVGSVLDSHGEYVPLNLLLAVILSTASHAESNNGSCHDVYWANQIEFGTFLDIERGDFSFYKFAVSLPKNPAMKDLFDYGTIITAKDGRVLKFLANKRLTKKDPVTGQYIPNPEYETQYNDLMKVAKEGRAYLDYGSFSMTRDMQDALMSYWRDVKKIFDVMGKNEGKAGISRDIDPMFVQILVPIVNGLAGKEDQLGWLPHVYELDTVGDKDELLDRTYNRMIGMMEPEYRAALEDIYKRAGKDLENGNNQPLQGVYETIEFFIRYKDVVFNDFSKAVGIIDFGPGSHWFAYKRLLDMANEKFFMLADITGENMELEPSGNALNTTANVMDRIRAEDARRIRHIRYDDVCKFEVDGHTVSLTAQQVREGWEGYGVKVKGSVIQGNTVLLPGSVITDCVINNSQGKIIATNSYVESATAPVIDATNSIIVKSIDKKEIIASREIVADAFRKALEADKRDARFPEGQTRMRAPIGYDPKPVYNKIKDSVKVKDEADRDVKFTIDAEGNVFAPTGKKVGVYTKGINIKDSQDNNIQRQVYIENKQTKEYEIVNGTLLEDRFDIASDHGLSETVLTNLTKALKQGQYYIQDNGKFATKAVSDYVQFGNNQYAFHEIREMPCDRSDNDKIEHDLRIKVFVPMLASQQGASLSDRQRVDIWVNAYLSGILADLYNRSLYYEVFSDFGVANIAQANQELSDKAVRMQLAYSNLILNKVDRYTPEIYAEKFRVSLEVALQEIYPILAAAVIERYAQKNQQIDGIAEKATIAKENLVAWMTKPQFADYHLALQALAVEAQTYGEIAKELFDSFYKTVTFGTGGRRGKVGIGPNRINPYMTALTTQGHCDYIMTKLVDNIRRQKNYSEKKAVKLARELMKRRGVVAAYDVREFKEYYPNTKAMVRYANTIFEKCPIMIGFSSKKMALIDGAVYTGNGIRYYMPSDVRSTPWLSFATANIHRILNDMPEGESYDARALAGTVKSSSHNLPDNNGDKFYEEDGGQAPPKESQAMMDKGAAAGKIRYYGDLADIEEAIRAAQQNAALWVDLVQGGNLDLIDAEYEKVNIEEQSDFVSPEVRRGVKIAFNALNGTGDTCLLPVLRRAGFEVVRSDSDVHDSTFLEPFEHRPNPEVEKTFDAVIRIAVKDDENALKNLRLKPVIHPDNRSITVRVPSDINMDTVLEEMRRLQVSEITDPDADRLGLAVKNITIKGRNVEIRWLTANDNDEAGIILFRYQIEKRLASFLKDKVYVFGTTVVSNEVEEWIVRDMAGHYGLNIVTLRHPVGFKFTGEMMTDIKNGTPSGIVGRIMETIYVNLNGRLPDCANLADAVRKKKAEFVMSFEEGEGGIIGSKGSVDKDSGAVGLALAMLAAEMRRKGLTVYDYLQETYRMFDYGKSYLEPIVLDGAEGQAKINEIVTAFKDSTPMSFNLLMGGSIEVASVKDYLKLGLQEEGVKTEADALDMILLTLKDVKLADGSIVKSAKVLIRGSGTEPKIKIWVMAASGTMSKLSNEDFEKRKALVDKLNKDVLDALLLKAYDMTDLSYNGYSVPQDLSGRLQLLRLDFNVALSKKLGNYFPMVDKIKKRAEDIIADRENLEKSIEEFSDVSRNTDLKALESPALVKDSFRINLLYQLKGMLESGQAVRDAELKNIAIQSMLLLDRKEGLALFRSITAELKITVPESVYQLIDELFVIAIVSQTETPGTKAVRSGDNIRPSYEIPLVSNKDKIVESILEGYDTGEEMVDKIFGNKIMGEFAAALAVVSNELNKRYATMTPEKRNEAWPALERFYSTVNERALSVSNIEVARGLQIMVGQTIAIQNLIDNGIKGAKKLQLTANPEEMLKCPDVNRGLSYLNEQSIREAGIEIAAKEGGTGIYWRGAEGIAKMGANISEEAKYDVEKFNAAKENAVLYIMDHGFMAVPQGILSMTQRQSVSTIHETSFAIKMLPGSIQFGSTGPGHFQKTVLDLKYVTEGKGIQYNKFYNEKGELVAVFAQYLKPGSWAVALPFAVDTIENLGELRFNDFSTEVPNAEEWMQTNFPNLGINFRTVEAAENQDKKVTNSSKVIPYYAVNINGEAKLTENIPHAPVIVWTNGIPVNAPSLTNLYSALTEQGIESVIGMVKQVISSPAWTTQAPSIGSAVSANLEVAKNRQKQIVGLGTAFILNNIDNNLVPRDWAGEAIRTFLNITSRIAEVWTNTTTPTYTGKLSSVPGTELSAEGASLPEVTVKQLLESVPEMLGGHASKPTFTKYLCTRFAPKVYMGFNEKIEAAGGTKKFTVALQCDRSLMVELKEKFKNGLTETEFNDVFMPAYEEWANSLADKNWVAPAPPGVISRMASIMKSDFSLSEFMEEVRKAREEIASYLNVIELHPGQVILCPVGFPHGIFGLGLQTHPPSWHPGAKNEAWIVISAGKNAKGKEQLILVEPQQMSDQTIGVADMFTPYQYKNGAVGMRKDMRDKLEGALTPTRPATEDEAIEIIVKKGLKANATAQNDFDITDQVANIDNRYNVSSENNAKVESLIEGTYMNRENTMAVWPKELFVTHRITLGLNKEKPAFVEVKPEANNYHELLVTKGKVTIEAPGRAPVTISQGESVFVPATIRTSYKITAHGEAEVLKFVSPLEQQQRAGELVVTGFEAVRSDLEAIRSVNINLIVSKKAFTGSGKPGSFIFEKEMLAKMSTQRTVLDQFEDIDRLDQLLNSAKGTPVVLITANEAKQVETNPALAKRMANVKMILLPDLDHNAEINNAGIPFIREIEAAGVKLAITEPEDISGKSIRAAQLKDIMSKLTGKAIDWNMLNDLIAATSQDPNVPPTFENRLATLLKNLQVKLQPYKADEGVRERRLLLWSV